MELFIRIKDGKPFEHPIFGDNFRQAFPDVDTGNLPPEFAWFERIPAPMLGVYEKNQQCAYVMGDDGVVRDVWTCEPMTAAEIAAKQAEVQSHGAPYPSWTFNADICAYKAPVSMPEGGPFAWRESDLSWVYVPPPPAATGWTFDLESGVWKAVTE